MSAIAHAGGLLSWQLVITWAVARKAVQDTLKALTWDMVCSALPSSQIELVWKSVQARHRQFQLRQPLCEANMYSSWVKLCSRPATVVKLPIQKTTVRWLLAWRPVRAC